MVLKNAVQCYFFAGFLRIRQGKRRTEPAEGFLLHYGEQLYRWEKEGFLGGVIQNSYKSS